MASKLFYPDKKGVKLEEEKKLKKRALLNSYEALVPSYEIMSQ